MRKGEAGEGGGGEAAQGSVGPRRGGGSPLVVLRYGGSGVGSNNKSAI